MDSQSAPEGKFVVGLQRARANRFMLIGLLSGAVASGFVGYAQWEHLHDLESWVWMWLLGAFKVYLVAQLVIYAYMAFIDCERLKKDIGRFGQQYRREIIWKCAILVSLTLLTNAVFEIGAQGVTLSHKMGRF